MHRYKSASMIDKVEFDKYVLKDLISIQNLIYKSVFFTLCHNVNVEMLRIYPNLVLPKKVFVEKIL